MKKLFIWITSLLSLCLALLSLLYIEEYLSGICFLVLFIFLNPLISKKLNDFVEFSSGEKKIIYIVCAVIILINTYLLCRAAIDWYYIVTAELTQNMHAANKKCFDAREILEKDPNNCEKVNKFIKACNEMAENHLDVFENRIPMLQNQNLLLKKKFIKETLNPFMNNQISIYHKDFKQEMELFIKKSKCDITEKK